MTLHPFFDTDTEKSPVLDADGDVLVERVEAVLQASQCGEAAGLDVVTPRAVPFAFLENKIGQGFVGRSTAAVIERQTAQ